MQEQTQIHNFREELKKKTQPFHDLVEQTPLAKSLAAGKVEIEAYTQYLSKLYSLHAYFEREIAKFPQWNLYQIDPQKRQRLSMLAKDLIALGIRPEYLSTSYRWNYPWDFSAAIGVMYVLEGSTMGGMFLSQRVLHIIGNDGFPVNRYFSGYGDETLPMWQEFCRFLNLFAIEQPDSLPMVTCAAYNMFNELERILREGN